MSLKDDLLEALRSVKRDFFRDSEHTDPQTAPVESPVQQATAPTPQPATPVEQEIEPFPETTVADRSGDYAPPQPDEMVYEAFKQASAIDEAAPDRSSAYQTADADEEDDGVDYTGNPSPFRSFDSSNLASDFAGGGGNFGGGRYANDFEDNEVYGSDKTIISRNTTIQGSVRTDDSLRLLGQVFGDIECRSNIVVAGKVQGNTTAANAYIFDAQVDGDLRCDDTINVSNDAWILGNLRAQQAEIDGKIKGNIEIRHMVSIGPSSSVLGDISADELEIKRGAFINGQVMMYSPSRDVLDRFDHFEE